MNEIATLAGGCFWCTEAIYKRLKGVKSVTPGYAGGTAVNPSYQEVSEGTTGHAESIRIEFDSKIISYDKILEIYWRTHDPTTMNRQGNDTGPQYRSEVFFHNKVQEKIARNIKEKLERDKVFKNPIVTKIVPFTNFYPAEDYHKNYYDNNRSNPYCTIVIDPKIKKLLQEFPEEVS